MRSSGLVWNSSDNEKIPRGWLPELTEKPQNPRKEKYQEVFSLMQNNRIYDVEKKKNVEKMYKKYKK